MRREGTVHFICNGRIIANPFHFFRAFVLELYSVFFAPELPDYLVGVLRCI